MVALGSLFLTEIFLSRIFFPLCLEPPRKMVFATKCCSRTVILLIMTSYVLKTGIHITKLQIMKTFASKLVTIFALVCVHITR